VRTRTTLLSKIGPSIALAVLGFAIVAAATLPHPGPRVGRRARLIDLIAAEDERSRSLRNQLDSLTAELDALQRNASKGARGLSTLQSEITSLGLFAGTADVTGSGIVVELRDSTLRRSPTKDPNDLVIHEQDIQAVVNALWAGGAEAMSINGERLTSESAVRCVGNTLLLHGSVYSPPYRISAIGDPSRLQRSLDSDPLIERFRIFVEDFHLGFDVSRADTLVVPAFRGVITRGSAKPIT